MYRGELVLRGIPSIDPGDVILLVDPGTGMTGPIEVDSVIHSFNQENGYITIVKPRLYISINEQASQEWLKRVATSFTNMFYVVFVPGFTRVPHQKHPRARGRGLGDLLGVENLHHRARDQIAQARTGLGGRARRLGGERLLGFGQQLLEPGRVFRQRVLEAGAAADLLPQATRQQMAGGQGE
jgi:hypothetical protein